MKWRLRPNPGKTVVSAFHLCNKYANRKLRIIFDGVELKHEFHPKYLGITLDRTLSFNENSKRIVAKVEPRINLIRKLAGSAWGADTKVLRTTTLALVYSVAEYGAPVWIASAHTHHIDVALNKALRIITGSITSTPIEWLSVLANIEPPQIRRTKIFVRQWVKQLDQINLPIHTDLNDLPTSRLISRKPPWSTWSRIASPYRPDMEWNYKWRESRVRNHELIDNPSVKVPGYELPRKAWVPLNRIRTGHGNCNHFLHLWNLVSSARCDCGALNQTMSHIVNDCPIRKFSGGIEGLNRLDDGSIEWLNELDLDI